jgi:Leucine-rich repeat (LRR) protein
VNPGYFVKGRAGQPFESIELIDVYVDAFPTELAELTELKLLGYADAERTEAMLRSLPNLRGLKTLRLCNTTLTKLPAEIAQLPKLELLEIRGNNRLASLPPELGTLAALRTLEILDCTKIKVLPAELAQLNLTRLQINPAISTWPAALAKLKALAVEYYK